MYAPRHIGATGNEVAARLMLSFFDKHGGEEGGCRAGKYR